MSVLPLSEPFFLYNILIDGREFFLEGFPDGRCTWEDVSGRKSASLPEDKTLEVRALLGDRDALNRWDRERAEFTVSCPLPVELREKMMCLRRSEENTRRIMMAEHREAIAEFDRLLTDFFHCTLSPLFDPALA